MSASSSGTAASCSRSWEHQASLVPQVQDDVGRRELLDTAPRVVDHDDVVDVQRVGERQLQPGEHLAEHRLRGETADDPGEPGGREQRCAERSHPRERHQCGGRAEHDENPHDDMPQDLHLGAHFRAC